MPQIPQKEFYKVKEVCRHSDIQPYVLRFWESEFPQLQPSKSRGGHSVYSKGDLDLVLRIKKLLEEDSSPYQIITESEADLVEIAPLVPIIPPGSEGIMSIICDRNCICCGDKECTERTDERMYGG